MNSKSLLSPPNLHSIFSKSGEIEIIWFKCAKDTIILPLLPMSIEFP